MTSLSLSQMTESVTSESVDWVSATQELKEKQGIDIKHEMDRLIFSFLFKNWIYVIKINI